MSSNLIDFSVIIPHRNSLGTLSRLFDSIPDSTQIEILLIDNTPDPVTYEKIGIERNYKLLYSNPSKGAGGARNIGLENAHGKWLIFADADDFFPADAFKTFYSLYDAKEDVIYFRMDGVYSDTQEPSDRGIVYSDLVENYLLGKIDENQIRLTFTSPCSKMVRKALVDTYEIRYDEVVASNDMYFSMLVGYYASKIAAINKSTYVATVTRGSLTRRRDYEVVTSRYLVYLRFNRFLKDHKLGKYQHSVMYFLYVSRNFGIKVMLEYTACLFKYRQNPFVGCTNWLKTFGIIKKREYQRKGLIIK